MSFALVFNRRSQCRSHCWLIEDHNANRFGFAFPDPFFINFENKIKKAVALDLEFALPDPF